MGGVSSIQGFFGFLEFFNFAKPLSQLQTRVEDSCGGCKCAWTQVMDHLIQENYHMEAYKVELHPNMQIFPNNLA